VNNNYLPDTEYIIHAHDKGGIYGEYKDKSRYIIHPVEKNDFNHPTVKPLAVMQKIIRSTSDRAQIILDPFMGSGSTGVACVKEGRSFVGIELDEDYFDIACKRITDAYAQPDMFVVPPITMTQGAML
jgi:DNA modification methylase